MVPDCMEKTPKTVLSWGNLKNLLQSGEKQITTQK